MGMLDAPALGTRGIPQFKLICFARGETVQFRLSPPKQENGSVT